MGKGAKKKTKAQIKREKNKLPFMIFCIGGLTIISGGIVLVLGVVDISTAGVLFGFGVAMILFAVISPKWMKKSDSDDEEESSDEEYESAKTTSIKNKSSKKSSKKNKRLSSGSAATSTMDYGTGLTVLSDESKASSSKSKSRKRTSSAGGRVSRTRSRTSSSGGRRRSGSRGRSVGSRGSRASSAGSRASTGSIGREKKKRAKKEKASGLGRKPVKLDEIQAEEESESESESDSDDEDEITSFDQKVPLYTFALGIVLMLVGGIAMATNNSSAEENNPAGVIILVVGVSLMALGYVLPNLLKDDDGDAKSSKKLSKGVSKLNPMHIGVFATFAGVIGLGILVGAGGISPIFIIAGLFFMIIGLLGIAGSCFLIRNREQQELEKVLEEKAQKRRVKEAKKARKAKLKAAAEQKAAEEAAKKARRTSAFAAFNNFVTGKTAKNPENAVIDPKWQYTSFWNLNQMAKDAKRFTLNPGAKKDTAVSALEAGEGEGKKKKKKSDESDSDSEPEIFQEKYKPYFIQAMTLIHGFTLVISILVDSNAGGPGIQKVFPFGAIGTNPWIGPGSVALMQMGALCGEAILKHDEIWRFITPVFIHVGLLHLAMNLSFQLKVGKTLETIYGPWRVAGIYMISGVGGNLVSAIFEPKGITAGASSSLYGLLGVVLIDLIQNWHNLDDPKSALKRLLAVIGFSLGIGLFPNLDNFAHVGGMIVGVFSGVIFLPTVAFGRKAANFKQGLIIWAVPCLATFFIALFYVFYQNTEGQFCPRCRGVNCLSAIFEQCKFADEGGQDCYAVYLEATGRNAEESEENGV